MRLHDFLRKNKKAVAAAVGLILVCVCIGLLVWAVGKNAVRQPQVAQGEIAGNEESQTEPSPKQETDLGSEPVTESQAESTEEPKPTGEPESTGEPEPAGEPESTGEPEPTGESEPTGEPELAEEPEPVLTEEYELIYEGINVFSSGTIGTYFRYKDIYADLYMRRLQGDTGEYVELSLWSDQKEIWHNYLFWWEDSEHLASDQRLCYYVVPIDGTVYLMRYCVETASDAVTMSYKVFGIDSTIDSPDYYRGYEVPLDAGSITAYLVSDSAVAPAVSFPVDEMTVFADTVKGYMENGYLAASTLRSVFESGGSADRDNPVLPYLYDIFPWIPEMVAQHDIDTEGFHSPKELLTALQNALPTDTSVAMPDVAADGKYFITGDYYSDSDESYLAVRMKEDGSYGGTLLIDNLINIDFAGHYDNGILTAVRVSDYPDDPYYEMEISFKNGKAIVTLTAAYEEGFAKVGDTFTLDRNEKPEEFEYLKNAEDMIC